MYSLLPKLFHVQSSKFQPFKNSNYELQKTAAN